MIGIAGPASGSSPPRLAAALSVPVLAVAACTWNVGRLAYRMLVNVIAPLNPGGGRIFMVRLSVETLATIPTNPPTKPTEVGRNRYGPAGSRATVTVSFMLAVPGVSVATTAGAATALIVVADRPPQTMAG